MYSYERSQLVSKLGFQDKDKQNARHSLACQFLHKSDVREALIKKFLPEYPQTIEWKKSSYSIENGIRSHFNGELSLKQIKSRCLTEEPILKGDSPVDNRYASFMGFVDTLIPFRLLHSFEGTQIDYPIKDGNALEGEAKKQNCYLEECNLETGLLCIEVKITQTSVEDILMQINFYKKFLKPEQYFKDKRPPDTVKWILLAGFDINEREVNHLANHGIHYFRLGEKFENFVNEKQCAGKPVGVL